MRQLDALLADSEIQKDPIEGNSDNAQKPSRPANCWEGCSTGSNTTATSPARRAPCLLPAHLFRPSSDWIARRCNDAKAQRCSLAVLQPVG